MTAHRTGRIFGASVVALTVAVGGMACGSDSGGDEQAATSTPAGAADANSVKVALFRFQPKALTVPAGTSVTWTNDDAILHTITAGVPGTPSGEFDQELPDKGATASVTFDTPGTFKYFCNRHPEAMQGEITVA